ncbi:MAG: hypothetical protein KDN05_07085, partial [Verrucomicrobiae bacterium]|nr:hypothetical protein [Verrucomicrobiae bacterium]
MKTRTTPNRPDRGFALVVTLSLMILLSILAVGLLSLSGIALRSSSGAEAEARAYANARMAVVVAISELQKHAGDDRRITADAAILSENSPQPHMVGVWDSWSPSMVSQPDRKAPDYDEPKNEGFRGWLVSSPELEAVGERDWHETTAAEETDGWVSVFSVEQNGFDLNAQLVETPKGAMAWAVSQENTKAKVNIGGRDAEPDPNVVLHAQRRPSLALSKTLKQPEKNWNLRAGRLCSIQQIGLDPELSAADPLAAALAGASHSVHSQGLLCDVVHGGLKTDLSLGFELGDGDFASSSWGDVPNPFRTPRV